MCHSPCLRAHECHEHSYHTDAGALASAGAQAALCVETLEEALARHGKPEIFNTDQGSQFTCPAFTGVLAKLDVKISMDGKGASMRSIAPR